MEYFCIVGCIYIRVCCFDGDVFGFCNSFYSNYYIEDCVGVGSKFFLVFDINFISDDFFWKIGSLFDEFGIEFRVCGERGRVLRWYSYGGERRKVFMGWWGYLRYFERVEFWD